MLGFLRDVRNFLFFMSVYVSFSFSLDPFSASEIYASSLENEEKQVALEEEKIKKQEKIKQDSEEILENVKFFGKDNEETYVFIVSNSLIRVGLKDKIKFGKKILFISEENESGIVLLDESNRNFCIKKQSQIKKVKCVYSRKKDSRDLVVRTEIGDFSLSEGFLEVNNNYSEEIKDVLKIKFLREKENRAFLKITHSFGCQETEVSVPFFGQSSHSSQTSMFDPCYFFLDREKEEIKVLFMGETIRCKYKNSIIFFDEVKESYAVKEISNCMSKEDVVREIEEHSHCFIIVPNYVDGAIKYCVFSPYLSSCKSGYCFP